MVFRAALYVALLVSPSVSAAMNFSIERIDHRPVQPVSLHVEASGVIESGDTLKFQTALALADTSDAADMLILFDSPGGNLMEGLDLADFLSDLPYTVSAQVGTMNNPSAICASACVYAYLGADYRYLGQDGRIGIHRAAISGSELTGSDGLALGQEISGIVAEHIRKNRAEPELFAAISAIDHDDIAWVPRRQLEDWRVVTNNVYDEQTEYRNINGKLALSLRHTAIYGVNILTLTCTDRGLIGVADLEEPEFAAYGTFEVVVDGTGYEIADWDLLNRDNFRGKIVFDTPPAAARAALNASTFGARVVVPSGDLFFGFEQTLRDGRVAEMVESCPAALTEPGPSMVEYPSVDFRGYDLTKEGFRNVSFQECKSICMSNSNCDGVSYVQSKSWCWPKARTTGAMPASGVISAAKR